MHMYLIAYFAVQVAHILNVKQEAFQDLAASRMT